MRRSQLLAVGWLLVVLGSSGCGGRGEATDTSPRDTRLVLEVGGEGPALGDLLRATAARAIPAPAALPPADPKTLSDGPIREYREVLLEPGRSLSQLCAAELGDAGRWREVAKLNGWTEAQVTRLPARQVVLLPPF